MNGKRVSFSHVLGVAVGSSAVAVVIALTITDLTLGGATHPAAAMAVVALIAALVGLIAAWATGLAVLAAGMTLLISDLFLAANSATILGFGHIALTDSIGLWPASTLLLVAMSSLCLTALLQPNRRWLILDLILMVAITFPTKLSSQFLI